MRKLTRRILLLCFFALCLASPAFGGTILFLGDSLTAGLGVQQEQAYPALIQQKIREKNLPFDVINAGISGDTTAGGLARLDWVLQKKIDVLVLALGANDGLRGLPIAQMKANLQAIIDRVKAKNPDGENRHRRHADAAESGRRLCDGVSRRFSPTSRARTTPRSFHFFSRAWAATIDLNQADQIHPTAAGHKIVAENVWRVLEPLLTNGGS